MAYQSKATKAQPNVVDGQLKCPQCGADLKLNEGAYGPYYGCTARCGYNISTKQVKVDVNANATPTTTTTPKPVTTNRTVSTKKGLTATDIRKYYDEVMAEFHDEVDRGFLTGEDIRAIMNTLIINNNK